MIIRLALITFRLDLITFNADPILCWFTRMKERIAVLEEEIRAHSILSQVSLDVTLKARRQR